MRSRFFLLIAIPLIISACSGSKKLKSLTEFTQKLVPNSSELVILGPEATIGDFANELQFVQYNKALLSINAPKDFKLKKIASLKNPLATMPYSIKGNLYIIDNKGILQSLNLNTEKINWSNNLGSTKKAFAVTLTENNNKLYVTSDLNLYVVNSETGKEISKRSLDDINKNYPAIYYNAFIIQTVSNNLIAYDTDNWKPAWVYETWPEYIASSRVTMPLLHENQLITGFSSGQVVSINFADGKELWQLDLNNESKNDLGYSPLDLPTQPLIQDNFLYLASNSGHLMKLDLSNGRLNWRKNIDDIISMIISGKTIFLTNNARQLAAISTNDGSVIWTSSLEGKPHKNGFVKPSSFTTPIVTSLGIFIFSEDGYGYLIASENGSIIKSFEIPKNIKYFTIHDGNIILFDNSSIYKLI